MGNNNRVSVNVDFKANISAFQSSLQLMKNGLAQLKLPNSLKDSFTKTFNQLENEIKNFQNLTSSGKMTVVNEKAIAKSQSQIKRLFDTIKNDFSKAGIQDAGFDKIAKQVDLLNQKYEKFQQKVNDTDLGKQVKDAESNLKRLRKKLASESAEVTNIIQTKADKTAADQKFKQEQDAIEKVILQYQRYEKYKALLNENGKIDVDKVLSTVTEDSNYPAHMKELAKNLGLAKAEADNANAAFNGLGQTLDNALSNKRKVEIEVKDAEDNLKKLKEDLEKLSSQDFDKFIQSMATSADTQNLLDWSKIINAKDYENAVNKLISEGNAEAAKVLMDLAQAAQKGGQAVDDAGEKIDKGADSLQKLGEREQDIQRLYNQLTQFFSISSAVQIFRRMVNSSIDAIKELDAAMTEVAVVTDFSVGDMWNQLPDYTTKANELGLAISDVYNASALYYQQGLDTAEVNSMVTSTLQMARIAGLDAAVATDRMTNAMRGFNMEINEANASHVADVYSNLAAKSASNVNELSVAMTKTASIAYSANMQFENVAAFLAQGIETTRESADTIGTMLKTVIGRFTEVKKAWSEGELKAEIDGEEINVNNVSKALRTAGINMNDFFTGARGLDEIFIELSSKWDSLDLVTQRYIATQAAGSRQQSRFIALMQDYSRQQELIGYAYNSSGAAQEQYEKTLDSLESKLNQLKNAWDRFTMGIANNQLVKFVVDGLTQVLNVINNLTDKLGSAGSMISKLGITIAALFGGGKLLKGLFGKVAGAFLGENSNFVKNFTQAGQEGGQGLIKGLKSILSNIDFKEAFSGFKNTSGSFQQIWDKSFDIKDNQLKDQIQNDLKNINENNYNTEAIEEFNEKYEELGITLDANAAKQEKTKATAQAMGVALMGVATVCGIISTALAKTGNTGAAEAFQKIATAAGIAGTAIMAIAPAIASIEGAVPILLVISATIMAIVAAISFFDAANENAKEKTERLANSLKSAQQAAENSKKAYEDLKSSIESLNDSQDALDGLVEGTREFQEALIAANQEVLNLLETYPQLARYLTTNKYGGLDITEQGQQEILDYQLEAANRAQANMLTSQLAVSIDSQKNKNETYDEKFKIREFVAGIGYEEVVSTELKNAFEQAYQNWKDSGEVGAVEESIINALSDFDIPTTDLNATVLEWIDLYENNTAQNLAADSEQQALLNQIYSSSMSDDAKNSDFAKLADYYASTGADAIAAEADAWQSSITNKNGDAGGEISSLANNLISGVYGEDLAKQASIIIKNPNDTGLETYQQIYQLLSGSTAEEAAAITDIKELSTQIGNYMASYDSIDNVESMIKSFEQVANRQNDYYESGSAKEGVKNLTDILTGTINESVLKTYSGSENETDLAQALGLNVDDYIELSESMGYTSEKFGDATAALQAFNKMVSTNIKTQQRNVKEQKTVFANNLANRDVSQSTTNKLLTNLSIEEIEVGQNLLDNLGNDISNSAIQSMFAQVSSGNISIEDISWLSKLNLNDSINAVDQLQKHIDELGDRSIYTKKEAQALGRIYKEISKSSKLSDSSQIQQVYSELSEDLDDLLEKNENLTADNIKDLATKGSNLSKVLKNTGVSASGLAKIFNGLKSGNLVINGLTDRVIKFISSLKSTEERIKEVQDKLSEFNEFDTGAGMDTLTGWSDKVKEYIDNFEYANAADILGEFFNEDYIKSKIGNWEQMSEAELDAAIRQLGSEMQNLTSNDGFNALYSFLGDENNQNSILGQIANAYVGEDGIGHVDIDYSALAKNGATLDDLANELTATGMSFDSALTILSTIAARDYKFDKVLDENNYKKAIEGANGTVYSQEELENMGAATNRSADEVRRDLGLAQYKKTGGQTQFGNIDLQNREIAYDDEGYMETVLGSSMGFGANGEVEIAFSPLLQTGTGTPIELNDSTISTYFNDLIAKAGGDLSEENLLKLDAEGLDVDGQHISNLMLGLGREAGESAHEVEEAAMNMIKSFALLDEEGNRLIGQELHESLLTGLSYPDASSDLEASEQELQSIADISGISVDKLKSIEGLQYDQLISSLQDMGLSLEQAQSEADVLASTLNTELTKTIEVPIMVTDESGNLTQKGTYEMTITADNSAALESIAEVTLQAQTIGNAVKSAFEEGAISVTINTTATEGNLATVQSSLSELIGQVNAGADLQITDNSSDVISNLNSINDTPLQVKTLYIHVVKIGDTELFGTTQLHGTAHASGIGRTSRDETALTGEMGQEMVVTGDHWYTVGDHGPEFAHIPAGSIVFNARQTRDLLTKGYTNTHGRAWASGTAYAQYKSNDSVPNNYNSSNSSTASAASSAASSAESAAESAGEAAKAWINTLDKLYNLVQTIEEETRRREILEKKYEKLLRTQNLTLINLRDNYKSQLQSFNKSLEYQKQLQKGRLDQINDVGNERYKMGDNVTTYAGSGATSYAKYNQSTNTIEIDWNAINGITDEDLGSAVEAYIKRLEELQDQYEDTYSEILEIETQIYELQQTYKEGYADFSQRVYDALVAQEEKRIENLEKVYSQISDDNSKILDELQEQIELERQIRDNTEKEKEIADKENQLAYLRRDTSNGNLLEIKKLEEELQDLREDYTDALIDQKLDKLSDDNEKAAAQRDLQIEQLNSILEYNKEHGTFWGNVESLMLSAFNPDGSLNNNSTLVALLKDTDAFASMSSVSGDIWMKELASAFHISAEGLEQWKIEDATNKAKEEIKSGIAWQNATGIKVENGATVHYNPSTGKWSTGPNDPWAWDLEYDAITGKYKNINGIQNKKPNPAPATQPQTQTNSGNWNNRTATSLGNHVNVHATPNGQVVRQVNFGNRFEVNGEQQDGWIRVRVQHNGRDLSEGWDYGWIRQEWVKYDRYAKGGLADFTGPAWLDGSKTHPELVLNARDTENFIALKDILAESLRGSSTLNTNNNGDNYFNISITVDELSNDYDVEQLASKIKEEITKDAKYRNVNTLNFLR